MSRPDPDPAVHGLDLRLAVLFSRLMLGLLFVVQGWQKVFEMGAAEHARRFFVEGYA